MGLLIVDRRRAMMRKILQLQLLSLFLLLASCEPSWFGRRIDNYDGALNIFQSPLPLDKYQDDFKASPNKRYLGLDISDYVTVRSKERPSQQRVQDMIKRMQAMG